MTPRSSVLVFVIATALAARAGAQPEDATVRAKSLYEEATKHYNLREYTAAIDSFKKAYELLPDAEFLFDIAQAYRQLRDCENASAFYKTYLRNRPDADNRAKVEKFVTDMEGCAQAQRTEREAARREAEARALAARTPPGPATPTPPPPRDHHRLRVAGIATGAFGLIATGVAIYYTADAEHQATLINQQCTPGCEASDVVAIDRAGRDSNRNAIVLYSIGGAAIATGAAMYLWAKFDSRSEPPVTIEPTAGGATVSTRVRF